MMDVFAPAAWAAVCAVMMLVCFAAVGVIAAWRRVHTPPSLPPAADRQVEVEGLRVEAESLKELLEARDRPGSRT